MPRVLDPTGAGVAAATVTAIHPQTNETATARTGAEGDYTIPLLKPGTYNIHAEAPNSKSSVREGIQLFVSDKRTVDFTLEVDNIQEFVIVSAVSSTRPGMRWQLHGPPKPPSASLRGTKDQIN